MKFSYRTATFLFFFACFAFIAAAGFLVYWRIEKRQIALQLFLQNQLDVDRQMLKQRDPLRETQGRVRSLLLRNAPLEERKNFLAELKNFQDDIQAFWGAYETRYAATQRPFLRDILQTTQESRLEEEELQTVRDIKMRIDAYFAAIKTSPFLLAPQPVNGSAIDEYLVGLMEKRNDIYDALNALSDIRFIFAQRIVFFISGENDRQLGFFTALFIGLSALAILAAFMQHFFIHRPFGDIMLFLKDMSQGKRGQRLYFSSPIREIKESEEIINQFVGEAEAHEKEK